MARKRGLELEHVIRVAASVADREGVGAVTLVRVASALGVRSPSLYSHVDGLAGLRRELALDGVRRLDERIRDSITGRGGVEALRAMAYAYRAFALEHPGSYAMIQTTPTAQEDPRGYAAFASVVPVVADALAEIGTSPDDAVALIRAFRSALHGFVSLEASGGFGLPDDIDRSFDVLVDVLVAGIRAAVLDADGADVPAR